MQKAYLFPSISWIFILISKKFLQKITGFIALTNPHKQIILQKIAGFFSQGCQYYELPQLLLLYYRSYK